MDIRQVVERKKRERHRVISFFTYIAIVLLIEFIFHTSLMATLLMAFLPTFIIVNLVIIPLVAKVGIMLIERRIKTALKYDYDEFKRTLDEHLKDHDCDKCPISGNCILEDVSKGKYEHLKNNTNE